MCFTEFGRKVNIPMRPTKNLECADWAKHPIQMYA